MKRTWLLFAQAVTILLAAYFVVSTLKPQWLNKRSTSLGGVVSIIEAPTGETATPPAGSFSAAARKASPAVVSINTSKAARRDPRSNDPWFRFFFGDQGEDQPQVGLGSGVIVSADGYILTNNHVVEGADEIEVTLNDSRHAHAKVVGTDPETDLAVLKVELDALPVVVLGNSDNLQVGDQVLAIGNPFGVGQTVTSGIVSALGRNKLGINTFENFIQTDAAINPGNSGGPLLNIHGEAVGMNTAIFSRSGGYMGIGFAIPINMTKSIEQQLRTSGKVTRGWLGIVIQDVDESLAKSFGGKANGGALISEVTDDSPAKKSGLLQGDIIIAINAAPVTDVADLRNRIAMTPPNTALTLQVLRDGKERDLTVTVGEQPADMASIAKKMNSTTLGSMGLTLQDLTDEIAGQFGYRKDQGVLIADVEADSPAAQVGLQAGQLIEEVNRVRVRSLKELQQAMQQAGSAKQVLLRVRAGEHSQYVVLRGE